MNELDGVPRRNTGDMNAGASLWLRVSILFIVIAIAALSLISFLNYSNYRKSIVELNLHRYLVIGNDIRQAIDAGLNSGLRPEENGQLAAVIDELVLQQTGIQYVAVTSDARVVASKGALPASLQGSWFGLMAATAPDRHWHKESPGGYEIGIPYVNGFGLKSGAVVVGYDGSGMMHSINGMLRGLSLDVVITLLTFSFLLFSGVWYLLRAFSASVRDVNVAIDSTFGQGAPRQLTEEQEAAAADINEFTALGHAVAVQLKTLRDELHDGGQGGRSA